MHNFSGKVAIVTGAAAGLGRATAIAFGAAGANVLLADVDRDGLDSAAQDVAAHGNGVAVHPCDVSSADSVAAMVDKAVGEFGGLDFAFNNAGIAPAGSPVADVAMADWDRAIAINLTGVLLCMKFQCPAMLARGGGAIVNTASVMGLVSGPGLAAYSASKFGVVGLTKAASVDYAAAGIRVNAVCPGGIGETKITTHPDNLAAMEAMRQMTPMQRLGAPDEIAQTVLWLCSPGAGYITGQAIAVDGGFSVC